MCLCRGRCVTIWESSHLRHRVCLRIWRKESLWISGTFPFLFWLSGTTLLTYCLCLISYQCPQHLHFSTICPYWSWLAFSNHSILASLSSTIYLACRRVQYRGRVVCSGASVVLGFMKTLRCKFISYLEVAKSKRLSWFPNRFAKRMKAHFLFASKFDNQIFCDLSPFSLAGVKNECTNDKCMRANWNSRPKTLLKITTHFIDFIGLHSV